MVEKHMGKLDSHLRYLLFIFPGDSGPGAVR